MGGDNLKDPCFTQTEPLFMLPRSSHIVSVSEKDPYVFNVCVTKSLSQRHRIPVL